MKRRVIGTIDSSNAMVSLPLANGVVVDQDGHGNWIAPHVPLYPGTNNVVGIQLKATVAGQNPSYTLATFEVHPLSTNLQYNGNGALLTLPSDGNSSGQATLGWNAEERLASVSTNSVEIGKYFYDDNDRRIAKIENGQLVLYIYDGSHVAGIAGADGALAEYYSRGAGLIDDVDTLNVVHYFTGAQSGQTYSMHSNHRGDIVMLTDSTGTIVKSMEYSPFGRTMLDSGSLPVRFTFNSKEHDDSGLVYYGFRYYSPLLNQWVSPDPANVEGGFNLYAYVGNDPMNFVDPNGFWGIQIGGLMIGRGNPYLVFDRSVGMVASRAAWATLDGINPFGNPFEWIYLDDADARADLCSGIDYRVSRKWGEVIGEAMGTMLGSGAMTRLSPVLTKSRWIGKGSRLFGRGGRFGYKGIFNSGRVRTGWGWNGSRDVFRTSWAPRGGGNYWNHLDWF